MGVRISWLMLARNSLFARLAASAASLASIEFGRSFLHQFLEMVAMFRQFLLGPFAIGDVADRLDGADDISFRIAQRRGDGKQIGFAVP